MMRALAVLGGLLLVGGVWLALDNPDVPTSDQDWYGGSYTCLAPYDTVLNHADNVPGGEPPPDADQLAASCRHAGRVRFGQAVALGAAGVAVAGLTLLRRRWPQPTPEAAAGDVSMGQD